MDNKELIDAINDLKESVDSLTTIQRDTFNVNTSTDDIASLRGKLQEVIQSNDEVRTALLALNGAINKLNDTIWKTQ